MDNSSFNTKLRKEYCITAPETTSKYLTSNKDYNVVYVIDEHLFVIIDDDDEELYCIKLGCQHINEKNWIIKT